jgi:hypothetical protein
MYPKCTIHVKICMPNKYHFYLKVLFLHEFHMLRNSLRRKCFVEYKNLIIAITNVHFFLNMSFPNPIFKLIII